jgi:ribose transport system substrate-binding protein
VTLEDAMPKRIILAVCAVCLTAACGRTPNNTTLSIAVIPKGTEQVYWQSIHAGAEKAAQELGVSVIWRGPLREDDRSAQIAEVEGFVTRGVSGIVLAPLDDTALVAPVANAARAKIPVVIIDSALKGQDFISYVATDNTQGGRLGGEGLASLLPQGGNVVLLRYAEGSASTTEREAGFLSAIAAHPNLKVVSDNQFGGVDIEGAIKKSEGLLSRFKKADGSLDVAGIFCPNESTTLAMLRVLEDNRWAGKVHLVGFDASDALEKGMRSGHIDGLVLQDPVKMGYLGVKTMVAHLRGQPVEARVDTGVRFVTPKQMDDPDTRELLHPDLTRWLKP